MKATTESKHCSIIWLLSRPHTLSLINRPTGCLSTCIWQTLHIQEGCSQFKAQTLSSKFLSADYSAPPIFCQVSLAGLVDDEKNEIKMQSMKLMVTRMKHGIYCIKQSQYF